jgi:rod shape-determining protein MreC
VPRQRTARIPLLTPSVPRSEGARPKGGGRFRARAVALALVLLSLALLTVYFRESSDGVLHGAQRIAVSVLTPFEVAAERIARPFRDAWGWTSDVLDAKEENAKLRAEVEELRRRAILNATAAEENAELRGALRYVSGPRFPEDFRSVVTRIIVQPQNVFRQEVVIAAGSSNGIRRDDPVVSPDEGLVGTVTEVTPNSAKVRLLIDQQSAASALVVETQATGIVQRGLSENTLSLDRVAKDERVEEGNTVVTAGTRVEEYESLYPRGIPICTVAGVSQRDIDAFWTIQCVPLVDFDSLDEVIVLVEKRRPKR